MKRRLTNTTVFDGYTTTGESDTTVMLDYTGAGGWNVLPDFAPQTITESAGDTPRTDATMAAYREEMDIHRCNKCLNTFLLAQGGCPYCRTAAAQADAERYRRVREFLQRGDGLLDTREMDDAGFDGMIDSLKECGK